MKKWIVTRRKGKYESKDENGYVYWSSLFSSISFWGGINHMREHRRAYGSQFSVPSGSFRKLKLVFLLDGKWPYLLSHLAGFYPASIFCFFLYFLIDFY